MFPRWLSWLVVALFAYLLVQGNRTRQEALPSAASQAVTAAPAARPLPPSVAEATDLERWKKAVNPAYAAAMAQCDLAAAPEQKDRLLWKVTQDRDGSGDGAKCTDLLQVKLTVWNARGEAAYTGELPLTLGARDVAAGLDAALVGMRSGGMRTVILAPAALVRDAKSPAPKALLTALGKDKVVVVTAERVN